MLVWVIILVVLSGFLFGQNIFWQAGEWQMPPFFWLNILWSVLILLVALGILVTMVIQRKASRGPRMRERASAPKSEPGAGGVR